MNFKEEYKKEVDMLCDNSSLPSGEEMFRIVQEKAPEERNFEMKTNKKMSLISKIGIAAAACVVLSGTTVYAFEHTSLGDLFRTKHKDVITAEIIDEGYFYEINETKSDSDFNVTLLGVTGDWSNPKLAFDIEILNDELASKTETIRLGAKILGEEEFVYNYDKYGEWEAEGVIDDYNPNLYHFDMPGPSAFMMYGEKIATDISYIVINEEDNFNPDMQFNFIVPMDDYKETYFDYYTGADFTVDGRNFTVEYGNFSTYNTEFNFLIDNDMSYESDELDKIAEYAKDTFVLTVDGTEYVPVETGVLAGEETAGIWVSFPSVDRINAQAMTITVGENQTDLMSCIADTSTDNSQTGNICEEFKGADFEADGRTFSVDCIYYYEDDTDLVIYVEDSAEMNIEEQISIVDDMKDRILLVADDSEYSAISYSESDYFDENDNRIKAGMVLVYPHIDRKSAEHISLIVDGTEINLIEYSKSLFTF